MKTVTLSPKFQVVIPKAIREEMALKSGIQLQVISYDDRIELIPVRSIKALKGLFKGMNTDIIRKKGRPL